MGPLKRRRPWFLLRPDQMLSTLASLRMSALLQHGGVWLAVPPELAELLNQCCTGQMDGGSGTAEEVAAVLTPLVGELSLPEGVAPAAAAAAAATGPGPTAAAQPTVAAFAAPAEAAPVDEGPEGAQAAAAAVAQEPGHEGAGPGGEAAAQGLERLRVAGAAGASSGAEAAEAGAGADGPRPAAEPPAEAPEAPGPSGQDGAFPADDGGAGGGAGAGGGRGEGPGRGGGRGGRGGRGRGRGRGGAGPLPYCPAALGCRLVAVRLTLEEAFFLHSVLGCLQVYELQPGAAVPATSDDVRLLDTQGLWAALRRVRASFVTSYAAYHHLKAKGWLPRSGLLYGVDFVTYQLHPVGAHSDYGVLVIPVGPDGRPTGPHVPPSAHCWLDLQITNRLVSQVVKKLLLLFLLERPGGADHATPACLANFAVEERLVRRWVPDATRD
ncbi:hypothetical protein HYH03_015800 [Edaphochlamys debaryana]|uniref:tRNA-intron lyase n=1 Tax=Edaphochlamys debaryana TaxID=47281 RepID=A0A835XIN6_9CHLO|nr:hypothetical protein HYH03_015800 [Edaphochlamys debaryana]|eukprot:KAG2485417.1 hypothetical protein HYH03_015800 [Edaphochlamys debaryana]